MPEQNNFNKRMSVISTLILIGLLVFSIYTFQPLTSGSQQGNMPYQVVMFIVSFLSGLAVVPVIGVAVGLSSLLSPNVNGRKVGAVVLWLIALYLLVGTFVIAQGGDTLIGIATIPMAILYAIVGMSLVTKPRQSKK